MAKVYLIYNEKNGKKYVGVTTGNVSQRFCQHIDSSYRKNTNITYFHKEIRESGEEVFNIFKYRILEECPDDIRFEKEIEYVSKIKPEYNEDLKQYYILSIKNKIIGEYKKGKTIAEIRTKYKCRHRLISNLLKSEGIEIQKSRNKFSKKVYMFDENGNVINEWHDVGRCSSETGIERGNIRTCCIKNTENNILYFSAKGKHFKYNKDTPKNMFEVLNKKTNKINYFKTKEALTHYFKEMFPDKNIQFGQLVRNRKTHYGYEIKKMYEYRN